MIGMDSTCARCGGEREAQGERCVGEGEAQGER